MLDTETKRRIDTARDILVGKVPDPKSQVEQITIALIYKFMDDMDAEAEELGGKRKFFTNEFGRYGWAKIMSAGIGGHELIGLYSEGISTMPQNAGIPPLFRDIFKNAYLPYRDPETLKSFLKIIDEFTYDHSERLGDAFEYLLSVLGSQGDAGQFRTPRHIIDFIVEIVDPKKNETVLDPACGTAGFLISSYKHILKANTDKNGMSNLTPDEKGSLAKNFKGYDISPDMVRLSLVNLYLHGFTDPHIYEYDSLTSDERWNEYADVILANPPFMSPKGGIKPHKRFTIQASRSEVLFVDYIAEHLTPTGRAGIIVPEGVIFQSQSAYKDLRKMLLDNSLVAVISLPAGIFNPYSGVKTSILILDKSIAKKSGTVAFFKVENDGYGLGAQRRAIDKNDLPLVQTELTQYIQAIHSNIPIDKVAITNGLIVSKERVAAKGEYSFSGERYRDIDQRTSVFPHVGLGDVVDILDSMRRPITKSDRKPGIYPYYGATGVLDYVDGYLFDEPLVLVGEDGAKWGPGENSAFSVEGKVWVNNHAHVLRPKREVLIDRYLIEILNEADLRPFITGVTVPKLNQEKLRSIQIPLPPLEVQRRIVDKIERYQKVIDCARGVLDNYRPEILINAGWPMLSLESVCTQITDGSHFSPELSNEGYPYVTVKDLDQGKIDLLGCKKIDEKNYKQLVSNGCRPRENDILFSKDGTVGKVAFVDFDDEFVVLSSLAIITPNISKIVPKFLYYTLSSDSFIAAAIDQKTGVAIRRIVLRSLKAITIPVPPLDIQKSIVEQLDEENRIIDANRKLIICFEKKIQASLGNVWGGNTLEIEEVI